MSATPERIVEAALAAGLDAIAVTDHNSVDGIEDLRCAAMKRGLVVFPGVEVTAKEGHALAIFDVDASPATLVDFLDYLGIPVEGHGDGRSMAADGMEEIFRKTVERGGIAVVAHIERWPSGFLESKEPRQAKAAIHGSKYLGALEITVPQNKKQWNDGQVWGYPTRRACIQTSDAHSPAEVGRRPVFIEMEQIDLASLKLALAEYTTRVFFPEEMDAQLP